jgi:hypothetical protein
MINSNLLADAGGTGSGGQITISTQGSGNGIFITGARISAQAAGANSVGGTIAVKCGDAITLSQASLITGEDQRTANGGAISLTSGMTSNISILNNSFLASDGPNGSIAATAGNGVIITQSKLDSSSGQSSQPNTIMCSTASSNNLGSVLIQTGSVLKSDRVTLNTPQITETSDSTIAATILSGINNSGTLTLTLNGNLTGNVVKNETNSVVLNAQGVILFNYGTVAKNITIQQAVSESSGISILPIGSPPSADSDITINIVDASGNTNAAVACPGTLMLRAGTLNLGFQIGFRTLAIKTALGNQPVISAGKVIIDQDGSSLGGLNIGGNITSTTSGVLNLTANNSIADYGGTNGGFLISMGPLNSVINLESLSGSVGVNSKAGSFPVNTTVAAPGGTENVAANGATGVFLSNVGNLNFSEGRPMGGSVEISTTSDTSGAGAITYSSNAANTSTSNISLTTGPGTNGNVTLQNGLLSTKEINVSADGSGNITINSGVVTAPTVNLSSGTGNIAGTTSTFSQPIQNFLPLSFSGPSESIQEPSLVSLSSFPVSTTNLTIRTSAAATMTSPPGLSGPPMTNVSGGTVLVENLSSDALNLHTSQAGIGFALGTLGDLTISGDITAGAFVGLGSVKGNLTIAPGAGVGSAGDVFLLAAENINMSAKSAGVLAVNGNILISAGTQVHLNQTYVTALGADGGKGIALFQISGQSSSNLVPAVSQQFLSVSPTGVFWGTVLTNENKDAVPVVTAKGPNINTVSALNSLVYFDASSVNSFVLENGTSVSATFVGGSGALTQMVPASQSALVPISYVTANYVLDCGISDFSNSSSNIWAEAGCVFTRDRGGVIRINSGSLLFSALRDTEFILGDSSTVLFLKKGAIGQVEVVQNEIIVRNLSDNSKGSVKMVVHDQAMNLQPGEQIQVGQILGADVPKRNKRFISTKISISEYSVPALLQSKKLAKIAMGLEPSLRVRLMKTAAALSVLTSKNGAFVNGE